MHLGAVFSIELKDFVDKFTECLKSMYTSTDLSNFVKCTSTEASNGSVIVKLELRRTLKENGNDLFEVLKNICLEALRDRT
jgi:hypothetical protein